MLLISIISYASFLFLPLAMAGAIGTRPLAATLADRAETPCAELCHHYWQCVNVNAFDRAPCAIPDRCLGDRDCQ